MKVTLPSAILPSGSDMTQSRPAGLRTVPAPMSCLSDSVSFGSMGRTPDVVGVAYRLTDSGRWRQAMETGWRVMREGIVPNAVLTAILVAGSAVVASLPVLASAVVPVLLAPTFFLACCVSDGLRGLVFGAFPKLDPGHWASQGWRTIVKRFGS